MVALAAPVVALSGTAVAATSLVSGDKLIEKGTLSGNRLRKDTVTGKQIKASTLGKVPSAKQTDNASHATSADNATNASHATSADSLPRQPPRPDWPRSRSRT